MFVCNKHQDHGWYDK